MSLLQQRIADKLLQQQKKSLFRQHHILSSPQDVEIRLSNGQSYVNFCSNDYLGLANHPHLKKAFQKAIEKFGCGSGASHLVTGHALPHHQLSEELADFLDVEAVLLYSSGYMANLGVFNSLLTKQDQIFQDKLNHASLIDAGLAANAQLKRYPHLQLNKLIEKLSRRNSGIQMIVSDGVFSMDGDIAPIENLLKLKRDYQAELMIDDAHGFGVLGPKGRGSPEIYGCKHSDISIYMATMGKAMGISGAFIAATNDLVEMLVQFSRTYTYTTAMPAAQAETLRYSLYLLQHERWRREKLQQLISYFKHCAAELNLPLMRSDTAIQPLLIKNTQLAINISQQLYQQGILVAAIRPPTVPKNTDRLRITLSANHEKRHIDKLLERICLCLV